jgi:hypothetical protein
MIPPTALRVKISAKAMLWNQRTMCASDTADGKALDKIKKAQIIERLAEDLPWKKTKTVWRGNQVTVTWTTSSQDHKCLEEAEGLIACLRDAAADTYLEGDEARIDRKHEVVFESIKLAVEFAPFWKR